MEVWENVVGYEGLYQVSNLGRIKSLERKITREKNGFWIQPERILKNTVEVNGYEAVSLYKNGKVKRLKVHRIVSQSFLENFNNKPCVNHKNGIKTDNRVQNLEWVTSSENTIHAFKNGLLKPLRGSFNGSSKLTLDQVNQIREMINENCKIMLIMETFSISRTQVQRIRNYECWK